MRLDETEFQLECVCAYVFVKGHLDRLDHLDCLAERDDEVEKAVAE